MKYRVDQALNCVFKDNVADISDLQVTLCAHTRIKNETKSTETFDFAFKVSLALQAAHVPCDTLGD